MSALPWGDRPPDVMASGTIKHPSGITYRDADLNDARQFEFAWHGRVLLGYLNLLVGEEGVGKGNLVAWMLARITRGELPGNLSGKPRSVAVIGDEDSWDNVWVPRLHAAGADISRAKYIDSGENGVLDVRNDADALAEFITEQKIAVVYFDQLLDNLGVVDSWKDKHVRDALAPLRRIVRDTNAAGVMTMHPNKRGGSFRDRVSGTPAFNALSRSSLLVAQHPHNPERKVAVRPKGNYTTEPPAFEFRIEGRTLKVGNRKKRTITTSLIVDERETSLRADDVLDAANGRRREGSKADVARRALAQLLDDGEPHAAGRLQTKLMKLYGLDARIVTRASTELGVKKWQDGFQGPWLWQLVADDASEAR